MFDKFIKLNVKMVTSKPKSVLGAAFIITIIAIILATGLSIELNWVALAPKGNEAVQEYEQILEDFPTLTNIVVLVESDDSKEMMLAINELEAEMMKETDYVLSFTTGLDQDFILDYGLLISEEAEGYAYMLADPNLDSFLMVLNEISKEMKLSPEELYMIETLKDFAELAQDKTYDKAVLNDIIRSFYSGNTVMTSDDGKMALLTLQPTFDMMDIKMLEPGVNKIEEVIKRVSDKYDHVAIDATGMHIVARDETASIQSDSSLTTIIAVVLIFTLLYFAFRAFSAPVLAFIPLILGIIWDVGLTKLVIGRLNMMTAFSAAMLLGLGIDYSIHLYSSYTERRASGIDKKNALSHALSITGPGIVTGGMTTAVAFMGLNISKLELLRELGTVMGLGIICTLISVFWVLPALIVLKKEKAEKVSKIKGNYPTIGAIASWVYKNKTVVIIVLVITTSFMAYQATKIEFDMNLLNLEPEGLASIELMERLVDEYDMSSDSFSVSVNSLEDVYRYHEAYEKVDGVKEVVSIASFIPKMSTQEKRIEKLNYTNDFPTPEYRNIPEVTLMALDDLIQSLENNTLMSEEFVSDIKQVKEALKNRTQLDKFSLDFFESNRTVAEQMLTLKPLTPNDLSESYKKQFVSEDGKKFLITVYPDFHIWEHIDSEKGEKFFNDMSDVNRSITGTPFFMKVLFDSVSDELLLIGSLLILVLIGILMIHFKSILYTMKAIIPLLLTLIYMVGTMAMLDMDFNMLNFLSILLIIGIGIDYGVHILHHYKIGEKKINYLFSNVGRAILLTTLTTVSGFGSLVFSSYRGIATLGSALSIGVGYAFIITIIVLPLMLKEEA